LTHKKKERRTENIICQPLENCNSKQRTKSKVVNIDICDKTVLS